MIKNVSIRNFKSIKELDFKAKRVNVFIGEPNTGKSNVLEALGMFSLFHSIGDKRAVPVRYQEADNLFYDNEISDELTVQADYYSYKVDGSTVRAFIRKEAANDIKEGGIPMPDHFRSHLRSISDDEIELFTFDLVNKKVKNRDSQARSFFPVKFYQFKVLEAYQGYSNFLLPPYGENLFDILMHDKELKVLVSSLLKEKGYRLSLRIKGKEIEMSKEIDDVIYTYPYQTLSDTIQRVIFYWSIIKTNDNSTILLEEPESHMSPFYIRDLAERIARDKGNQYFLVTHNPYFLVTLVEKTKLSDLSVSVTYLEDYQTKLKRFTNTDLEELTDLDTDIFFNLDKFIEVGSLV